MSTASPVGRPTTIADAGPGAVPQSRPEITGEELVELRAMRAFDAACVAVETHEGPKAGSEWQDKLAAYQSTYAAWRRARRAAIKLAARSPRGTR